MITLWVIGWFFTLGFIKEEASLSVTLGALIMWPIMIGAEIRELLEKK